jgi:hypothetical protein
MAPTDSDRGTKRTAAEIRALPAAAQFSSLPRDRSIIMAVILLTEMPGRSHHYEADVTTSWR